MPHLQPTPGQHGVRQAHRAKRNLRELLYILSPSYSGSTLLTFLLAAHPQIATVGELKASAIGDVGSYRCSCGALLTQCGFWQQVKEDLESEESPFEFSKFGTHFTNGSKTFRRLIRLSAQSPLLARTADCLLSNLPAYRKRREQIIERNQALIEVISSIQNGRVFLDGSKDPERLDQLFKSGHWNIKAIRLLRDGRGTAYSYMKHTGVSMEQAAREFARTDHACDRIARRLSASDVIRVRYEELCSLPGPTVEGILSRLRLSSDGLALRRSPSKLHILGNSMRLKSDNSISLDEAWRRELDSHDLATFGRIAGVWNTARGYA